MIIVVADFNINRVSILEVSGGALVSFLHFKLESVDATDDHALTGLQMFRTGRVPRLTIHKYLTRGRKHGLGDANLPEHAFFTGDDLVLARAVSDSH